MSTTYDIARETASDTRTARLAGVSLALASLLAIAGFTVLGSVFQYPQILEEPTSEILVDQGAAAQITRGRPPAGQAAREAHANAAQSSEAYCPDACCLLSTFSTSALSSSVTSWSDSATAMLACAFAARRASLSPFMPLPRFTRASSIIPMYAP
jgi:hypothetical protein